MKRGLREVITWGRARAMREFAKPSPKRQRGVVGSVGGANALQPVARAPGSVHDAAAPSRSATGAAFVMALTLITLFTGSALAQTGGGYDLTWNTIDGGGGTVATGSGYEVSGTIGQANAGKLSGGGYFVNGGFWAAPASACPGSSTPEAETLPGTPLQFPLAGGTGAHATGLPVNTKNRFASIKTADAGRSQAIRVRFVDLPSPFTVWNGMDFYAGVPREVCENSGKGLETAPQECPSALPTDTFWAAPLLCVKGAAHFMDWRGRCDAGTCVGGLIDGAGCIVDDDCVEVVHFYHEGLVPGGIYDIQVIDNSCSLQDEGGYSAALTMIQSLWGDVCGPGPGGACSGVADGTVDVTNDVLGVLDKFANVNSLQKARADLEPGDDGDNNGPDFKVNVANDVLFVLDAFTGGSYPFTPGDPCNPG